MTVESTVALPRKAQVTMTRVVFPSVSNPAVCEKYILRNTGESAVNVEIPVSRSVIDTDPAIGVDGSYKLVSEITNLSFMPQSVVISKARQNKRWISKKNCRPERT